jgi:uncharacterized protein Yka (UPF0111/DUF47 family)
MESTDMSRKGTRWFLPDTPDVVSMLQKQAEITARGMDAFADWADGEETRADDVRAAEHECDEVRRTLVDAVSEAFTTPLQPEDLFQLSRDLDKVINGAKNTVREAEAMNFPPDAATAEMAVLLAEGVHHLAVAFNALDRKATASATAAADAAVTGRREFYRRISSISDDIVSVADRIWYSEVKES